MIASPSMHEATKPLHLKLCNDIRYLQRTRQARTASPLCAELCLENLLNLSQMAQVVHIRQPVHPHILHSKERCRLRVVSLTFHVLSKIISRKYTIPETIFMVRISSWNFACVPKAWHTYTVSTWNSHKKYDSAIHQFRENILESSRTGGETTPVASVTI